MSLRGLVRLWKSSDVYNGRREEDRWRLKTVLWRPNVAPLRAHVALMSLGACFRIPEHIARPIFATLRKLGWSGMFKKPESRVVRKQLIGASATITLFARRRSTPGR